MHGPPLVRGCSESTVWPGYLAISTVKIFNVDHKLAGLPLIWQRNHHYPSGVKRRDQKALIGPLPLCPVLVNRRMDDGLAGQQVDRDERN